jgi:hypothetical protein
MSPKPKPPPSATSAFAEMSSLILKFGSASRPSGEWRDDDYEVVENGVVGRIFKVEVAPRNRPFDVGERSQALGGLRPRGPASR